MAKTLKCGHAKADTRAQEMRALVQRLIEQPMNRIKECSLAFRFEGVEFLLSAAAFGLHEGPFPAYLKQPCRVADLQRVCLRVQLQDRQQTTGSLQNPANSTASAMPQTIGLHGSF